MSFEIPSISDSEWLVASEVWAKEGLTASDIAERLAPRTNWKQKTINTFLARLVTKGILVTRLDGRAFRYFPQVPKEQCIRQESESFLKRVFGGAAAPMLAHFCETQDLSPEEIDKLRDILKRKGKRSDAK